MLQIQKVRLPDGTEYVALTNGKRSLLFEWDSKSGDYKLVIEPVFGSWSKDNIELEQKTIE